MNKLLSFIKQFTKDDIAELKHVKKIGRQYYLVEGEALRALKIDMTPFSIGLYLGELKQNKLEPGFPLLDLIAKHNHRKAIIGKKGETLLLYGNDIIQESIISTDAKEGIVMIENEQHEVLGYGEVVTDRRTNQLIIKNSFNRSDFLRREGGNKKNLKNKRKKQA